jgi:chemotaxis regulatin CheY-phosphate phosphatase CheZ
LVTEEEHARVSAQAAKRRLTLSRYMKECLLGEGQEPYPQVDNENGQVAVLEVLFRESEQRISQQYAANAEGFREVLSRLSLIATTVDQFARTKLLHPPETQKHHQEKLEAGAAANAESFHEVLNRLTLIATMVDQFARTMLIHTPEIPKDQQERSGASGERRHRNWQRVVADLIKEMDLPDRAAFNGAFLTEVAQEGDQ